MNVFIQIATFEQGQEMLELFQIPKQLLGESVFKETFTWIGLNGKTASVSSLGSLKAKPADTKFTQIGYKAQFNRFKVGQKATLKEIYGVLVLPETSRLWADQEYWEKGTFKFAYRRARDAKCSFDSTKRAKVIEYPAILELTLVFTGISKQDDLARFVADWIGNSIKPEAFGLFTCIVGDIDDSSLDSGLEFFGLKHSIYSMYRFLNRYILGTYLLKTRIDRLHSIHIHNKKILEKVANVLDLEKPIYLCKDFSVLTVPKKMLASPKAQNLVAKFAIPQDETTSWEGLVKREGL